MVAFRFSMGRIFAKILKSNFPKKQGHGGQKAADFSAVFIHKYLLEELKRQKQIEEALKAAISRTEEEFLQKAKREQLLDGTTVCVVVINRDKMIIANVGDSEIVLCKGGNAVLLSEIHNPKKNDREAQRVERVGGKLHKGRVKRISSRKVFVHA